MEVEPEHDTAKSMSAYDVESAVDCVFNPTIFGVVPVHLAEMPRTVSDALRIARLLTAPAFHPLPSFKRST
jgi:hypothetical protein